QRGAEISSTAMVVVSITFLTIIFGELVPKRIGLMYPEVIARRVALPMEWLSVIARRFVKLLSWCTEGTMRLLGIRGRPDRTVSAHEHSRYPVCRGGLDDVLGVVSAQSLLQQVMRSGEVSLADKLQPSVFVPETLSGMELLDHFRGSTAQLVFVVDEYGEVQG